MVWFKYTALLPPGAMLLAHTSHAAVVIAEKCWQLLWPSCSVRRRHWAPLLVTSLRQMMIRSEAQGFSGSLRIPTNLTTSCCEITVSTCTVAIYELVEKNCFCQKYNNWNRKGRRQSITCIYTKTILWKTAISSFIFMEDLHLLLLF